MRLWKYVLTPSGLLVRADRIRKVLRRSSSGGISLGLTGQKIFLRALYPHEPSRDNRHNFEV